MQDLDFLKYVEEVKIEMNIKDIDQPLLSFLYTCYIEERKRRFIETEVKRSV